MAWTYSGDPSKSELDKYRFLIGDTDVNEPILQNEEVLYILGDVASHNARLYHLYDMAAQFFARKISRKLGPQSEFTSDRLKYFQDKATEYKSKLHSSGISLPKSSSSVFNKGMHDNV